MWLDGRCTPPDLVMSVSLRGQKWRRAGTPYYCCGASSANKLLADKQKIMRTVAEWDKILEDEPSDNDDEQPPLNPEMLRAFAATSDENALSDDWKRAHQDLCARFNDGAASTHPISQTPLAPILDSQTARPQSPDACETSSA